MKPSKRLSALLLALCLIVSLIAPAVYAEEEEPKTVIYDFDFVGIAKEIDGKVNGTGLTAESCQTQIANLKNKGHINWCYKDISFTSTAGTAAVFTVDGYFRGRAVVGDWVALTIDNPGEGTWKLDLEYVVTYCGAQQVDVYILPGSVTDIAGSLSNDYLVGNYDCYDRNVSSDTPTGDKVTYKNTELSHWTAGSVEEKPTYTLVLQAKTKNGYSGEQANIQLSKLTMTQQMASVTANEETTYYQTAGAAVAAINAAESGTIALLADVTSSTDIVLKNGVTLDLNGKTLDATVDARAGILTDSSNGGGKIANTAVFDEVGSNEVALVDGEYFRIFDYALEEVETVKNGDAVHFWFDVTLSDEAYALIAKAENDSEFNVGATLQWNDNTPEALSYGNNLNVKDWATKMQTADYSFYVKVTGLSSAAEAGTLKVMPTVSGKVGGGSLAEAMTCSVEAAQ